MTAAAPAVLAAIVGKERIAATAVGTIDIIDPSDGSILARVPRCGAEEIDQAVQAARGAFDDGWGMTSATERATLLRRMAALIRRDRDDLAATETRDTGKPLSQARADVDVAARYFEFYGSAVETTFGSTMPSGPGLFVYTAREPYGVTGHIVPWNYPIQITARTAAPTIAAGNCAVVKPAEDAPLTALRLGELALEAGFPPGVLNVVPGLGEEAGAALAAHPGIDHLSFTGSEEVGRSVGRAAAESIIPVTLELGGKSPNIVFADADLGAAVPVVVNSIIQNAGQTCSAGSRLLVERRIHHAVVEAVVEEFRRVTIGPGIEDPRLGPLISARQRDRVETLVHAAVATGGARLVVGGGRPAGEGLAGGFYFEPTLLDRVPPDARVAQDEVFGPVLTVIPFGDAREAARIANGTRYGLIAAVWTADLTKAHWLARRLRAGQIFVNTYGAGGGVDLPFGGYGRSGHGREKGVEGLLGYTQVKSVVMRTGEPPEQPDQGDLNG